MYKEDVVHLCDLSQSQTLPDPSGHLWKSVIILVPVRLGGEALNPSYIECVKVGLIILLQCCKINVFSKGCRFSGVVARFILLSRTS